MVVPATSGTTKGVPTSELSLLLIKSTCDLPREQCPTITVTVLVEVNVKVSDKKVPDAPILENEKLFDVFLREKY